MINDDALVDWYFHYDPYYHIWYAIHVDDLVEGLQKADDPKFVTHSIQGSSITEVIRYVMNIENSTDTRN